MKFILLFLVGGVIGFYLKRVVYKIKKIYRMWKMGICFHYKGKGYRETIDGTNSEFCERCGHPAGYHFY